MDDDARNAEQSASEAKCCDANNRFQLRLAASAGVRPSRGKSRIATRRRLRVLIVDNDRDATDTLAALVSLWGHDVWSAYDGATGLAIAAAASPDVVLLDIAMPEMDGCELAVQLRKRAGLQDCFLIAVTGFGDEKHRRQCRQAGIDLFLVKPVEAVVMGTLLMLERQRLGLSRAVPLQIGDDSKKYGATREAALV